MITVQNSQLLAAQDALQPLAQASLRGTYALQLKEVLSPAQARLKRLQEVQQELMEDVQQGTKTDEEADEEWQEVLGETLEIDEEPLPEEAFENIEISAGDLMALDWLIADGEDEQE